MKHLKAYENTIKNEPQIGDYVICKDKYLSDEKFKDFLSNNIGEIVDYNSNFYELQKAFKYIVKYDNIPENIKSYFNVICKNNEEISNARGMSLKEILFFSKNKEDLQFYLDANKYNL